MFKAILEVAITLVIVVGTLAVAFVVYRALHAAIYDPSLPHDALWRILFDPGK